MRANDVKSLTIWKADINIGIYMLNDLSRAVVQINVKIPTKSDLLFIKSVYTKLNILSTRVC